MNNEQKRRVEEIAEREKKATPGPWIRNDTETYAEIMAENGTIIPFLLTVIAEQEAEITNLLRIDTLARKREAELLSSARLSEARCAELEKALQETTDQLARLLTEKEDSNG
jgi:diphthamide synthase (EF-2-diphthine--ammonia ligase)